MFWKLLASSAPSGERAAAARALSCRAAVAVLGDRNRRRVDLAPEEIRNVSARLAGDHERNAEHLVEITVVEIAAVIDRHERAAHDAVEIRRVVRRTKQRHVGGEL